MMVDERKRRDRAGTMTILTVLLQDRRDVLGEVDRGIGFLRGWRRNRATVRWNWRIFWVSASRLPTLSMRHTPAALFTATSSPLTFL